MRISRKSSGFTLIELLMTVAVAAIAATVAIPSYQQFIASGKEKAATNSLLNAVRKTRSEAITRNTTVSICRSADLNVCNTAADKSWRDGWIYFTDENSNGDLDGGDTIIGKHEELNSAVTIAAEAAIEDVVRFRSSGRAVATGAWTVSIDDRPGYTITLSTSGRVKYEQN